MMVDHIFIFSDKAGKEADELKALGFKEGSSRVHPDQGTRNRKFYFQNFFLEILWVHNEEELKNGKASKIGLLERSKFATNNYSRFGLGLVNDPSNDTLFLDGKKYFPAYFPEDLSIEYINEKELPWLFRLPFKGKTFDAGNEPINHPNNISTLSRADFSIRGKQINHGLAHHLKKLESIEFKPADDPSLCLTFDEHQRGKEFHINSLNLVIRY
jgi:hypothetical protein